MPYAKNLTTFERFAKRKAVNLSSKSAHIERASYYGHKYAPKQIADFLTNPENAPEDLKKYLPQDSKPTTPLEISVTRNYQRRSGLDLKRFKGGYLGISDKTRLLKSIIEEFPEYSNDRLLKIISERYPNLKITKYILNYIRHTYLKGHFSRRIPIHTLPKLSPEQQNLLVKVKPMVSSFAKKIALNKHFEQETINDFLAYVDLRLIRWIARYDPNKSDLKKYLIMKVIYARQDFIRIMVSQSIGESSKNIRLLFFALKQLGEGQSIEQIAKEKGISKDFLEDLIYAYNSSINQESFDELVDQRKI